MHSFFLLLSTISLFVGFGNSQQLQVQSIAIEPSVVEISAQPFSLNVDPIQFTVTASEPISMAYITMKNYQDIGQPEAQFTISNTNYISLQLENPLHWVTSIPIGSLRKGVYRIFDVRICKLTDPRRLAFECATELYAELASRGVNPTLTVKFADQEPPSLVGLQMAQRRFSPSESLSISVDVLASDNYGLRRVSVEAVNCNARTTATQRISSPEVMLVRKTLIPLNISLHDVSPLLGMWNLSVTVEDLAGNIRIWSTDELALLGFPSSFLVEEELPSRAEAATRVQTMDIEPPTLVNLFIGQSGIFYLNVSNAANDPRIFIPIPVTVHATDNVGLKKVTVIATRNTFQATGIVDIQFRSSLARLSIQDAVIEVNIPIHTSNFQPAAQFGEYQLTVILEDLAGNQELYTFHQLKAMNFPSTIQLQSII